MNIIWWQKTNYTILTLLISNIQLILQNLLTEVYAHIYAYSVNMHNIAHSPISWQCFHVSSILLKTLQNDAQREKCPNTEFIWSLFSHIRTEYVVLGSKSPYSVRIRENTDPKKGRIWTLLTYTVFFFTRIT